jgi:hypothetical protein
VPSLVEDVPLAAIEFMYSHMMAHKHVSAVLLEIPSISHFMANGQVEKDPFMVPVLTSFESLGYLPVGELKPLVHSASLHNEKQFTGTL